MNAIRERKPQQPDTDQPRRERPQSTDLATRFVENARQAIAIIRVLDTAADIPATVAGLLRERNLPSQLHMPQNSFLRNLSWSAIGSLSILASPPGPNDAALSSAPMAIAETGTLVFPASQGEPASWHFRPGFEITVLEEDNIVADLDSVLSRLQALGNRSHTINLVTGPSRTGDIEQTLELGAHGPKALAILLIRSRATQ